MKSPKRIVKLFMRSAAGEEISEVVDNTWGDTQEWLAVLGTHCDFVDSFDKWGGCHKTTRYWIYRIEFIK